MQQSPYDSDTVGRELSRPAPPPRPNSLTSVSGGRCSGVLGGPKTEVPHVMRLNYILAL